ncbi:MAG: hypothetical protein AB2826_24625 [Candidatus Thiodiazotropha sp.]
MAISDNNPERRNLVLASIAFVIYYAAGGSVSDENIRILVINITFSKPEALAFFAWGMLCWFALRFWQKNGFSFWGSLVGEILKLKVPKHLHAQLTVAARNQLVGTPLQNHTSNNIEVASFLVKGTACKVLCNFTDGSGKIVHQEIVPMLGVVNRSRCIWLFVKQFYKGNAFAEEMMPYLLFLLAITAPMWSPI